MAMLLEAHTRDDGVRGMTIEHVRDQVLTLFLTAFDTTSLALTWTWYLISQHPVVEAELHREPDSVLGGRPPTSSDVAYLRYARMVLSEAIRLYPPLYAIAREVREDRDIGGYAIPRGPRSS